MNNSMGELSMEDCGLDSCPVPGGFLTTEPSIGGNAVLMAGFAAVIPINVYFGLRHGTLLYTLLLVSGILMEILDHIGSIMMRDDLASRHFFTLHLVGAMTGPTFITAAIYLVLPHILSVYGERLCVFPSPLWLGLLFFGFDVFALAFQIVGCVFTVDGTGRPEMGQGVNILIAGLGIQIVSLVMYFVVYYAFVARLARREELLDSRHSHVYCSHRFKIFLLCLQTAAGLVLARTIMRVAQLTGGMSSDLFQSQPITLALDSAVILLACIILTALPPAMAFGSRTWAETSPHMVGFRRSSASRRREQADGNTTSDGGGWMAPNYALRANGGVAGPVREPYHPVRGQEAALSFGAQIPAHYQYPNLHRATSRPGPIQVARYGFGGDGNGDTGQAMRSDGSQTYADAGETKRVSPRQVDMVDHDALWG